MKYILFQNIFNILYMVLMVIIIIRASRLMDKNNSKVMLAVFFTFSSASFFMEDLYWIAYDFLRPEARMPIAANEVAESAAFLMLSAVLANAVTGSIRRSAYELAGTTVFIIASIAFWIGWSGEWVQDIIGGISFGYLRLRCVWAMKSTDALSAWEWRGLGAAVLALTAIETGTFFAPEQYRRTVELAGYALMSAVVIFLYFKVWEELKRGARPKALMALSFSCFVWGLSCMYMSENLIYVIFYIASIVIHPVMLLSVKKEMQAV